MNIEQYLEPLPLISRLLYFGITFLLNYLLLLFFFVWLEEQLTLGLLFDYVLVLTVVTAGILSSIVLFSDRILRRLSRRWEYTKLRNLQRLATMTSWGIIGCLLFSSIVTQFFEVPLWLSVLMIVLMDLFFYLPFLQNFISNTGEAILSLQMFLIKVETDVESVNFKDLVFSLKKVNKIAKRYNMSISPKSLALAITTSFFKNRQRTMEEINEIIKWLSHPRIDKNFNSFCNVIERYNKDSKMCENAGIINDNYWTFERTAKIIGILTSLVVAILSILIPLIMQRPTQ